VGSDQEHGTQTISIWYTFLAAPAIRGSLTVTLPPFYQEVDSVRHQALLPGWTSGEESDE